MASKLNTVQGISNGTTITNVNSGGASGDIWQSTSSTGATLIADNTHAPHGTVSMKIATTTSATSFTTWTLTASGTWWFRVYYWVDSITAATNPAIMRFRGTADTVQAIRVTFDATGHMQIRNTANTVVGTSTAAFTLSQWNRIEGFCTPGAGTTTGSAEIKMFVGDQTTPIANGTVTVSGQNFGSVTNIDAASFGQVVAFTSLPAEWMAYPTVSNVNYPGPQVITLSPNGITSAETVPTPTITPSPLIVSMPSIASAQSVPTPTITPSPLTIHPSSITSAEAVPTPTITPGAAHISMPSILSAESVPTPSIVGGPITINMPSIGSQESVGTPSLSPAPFIIGMPSIPSAESVPDPTITGTAAQLLPPSIGSQESVPTPTITPSLLTISMPSIGSQESVGVPSIFERGNRTIFMPSIESEEQVGPVIVARISPARTACCDGEQFRRSCCSDSLADVDEEQDV